VKGKKVLLIEDIITTGRSVMNIIKCIEKHGGKVIEIRCIWNRSDKDHINILHGKKEVMDTSVPILSIINDPVESWEPDECPLCGDTCEHCGGSGHIMCTKATGPCSRCSGVGILNPLTDPKTGEVI